MGAGCTDDAPCSNCPQIEGSYAVAFDPDTAIPPSADCQALGITGDGGTLTIARAGSGLSGTYGSHADLTGMVSDSWHFTLDGTASDGGSNLDSVSFSGRYVPDALDGGHHLYGTYAATVRSASRSCDLSRDFTAAPVAP